MRIEDSEVLGEFLSEQVAYNADLKAMILLMVEKQEGNVSVVSEQTGVAISTIYHWVSEWNSKGKYTKKSLSSSRGKGDGARRVF